MECFTFDISAITPYWTIFKDLVTGTTAIWAVCIANKGLTTWNRQLKGSAEYELARRILKRTYNLREAIAGVRHPLISSEEQPLPPPEEAQQMSLVKRGYYGVSNAYQTRWQKAVQCKDDLQADLLEAEALWGDEIKNGFSELFSLQQELFFTLRVYLRAMDPDENPDMRAEYEKMYAAQDRIIYASFSKNEPDPYAASVDTAIKKIESLLKIHLRKT